MNKTLYSLLLVFAVVFSVPQIHADLYPSRSCLLLFQPLKATPVRKNIEIFIGSAYQKSQFHKYEKWSYDVQLEFIDAETIMYRIQETEPSGKKRNPAVGFIVRVRSFGQASPQEIYQNTYLRITFDDPVSSNNRFFPRALGMMYYTPNGRKPISVRIAHQKIANDLDLTPTYN